STNPHLTLQGARAICRGAMVTCLMTKRTGFVALACGFENAFRLPLLALFHLADHLVVSGVIIVGTSAYAILGLHQVLVWSMRGVESRGSVPELVTTVVTHVCDCRGCRWDAGRQKVQEPGRARRAPHTRDDGRR